MPPPWLGERPALRPGAGSWGGGRGVRGVRRNSHVFPRHLYSPPSPSPAAPRFLLLLLPATSRSPPAAARAPEPPQGAEFPGGEAPQRPGTPRYGFSLPRPLPLPPGSPAGKGGPDPREPPPSPGPRATSGLLGRRGGETRAAEQVLAGRRGERGAGRAAGRGRSLSCGAGTHPPGRGTSRPRGPCGRRGGREGAGAGASGRTKLPPWMSRVLPR